MYSRCVSEKSAAQQRQFEAALLEIMKDRLFEEVSVSELCRFAGLSRKTFYRLYEAKADVVYAMIDHAILDAGSFIPDQSVKKGGMHKFLSYWKSRSELLDVLKKNRISALLSQQAVIHIMQEAPEIRRCFGAEGDVHGEERMIFYVTGLFSLVLAWHNRNFDLSVDEMSELLMSLMTTVPIKQALPIE